MLVVTMVMVLLTIPSGIEVDLDLEQLEQDVAEAAYSPEDYVRDVFDCSDMTMVLGRTLEKKGYIVTVVVGYRLNRELEWEGHMWLIVNGVDVEPTAKRIVPPEKREWYYDYFWSRKTYLGTEAYTDKKRGN